jgi:ATP-binding cassette subfamily B protein
MTPSAVQASTSSYVLASTPPGAQPPGILASLARLLPLMATERQRVTVACVAVLVSSITGLLGPLIIAHTIDLYIRNGDFRGVLTFAGILLVIYAAGFVSTYVQTLTMGGVGRRVLFAVRNSLFTKLQQPS